MLGLLWLLVRFASLHHELQPGWWLLAPLTDSVVNYMGIICLMKSFTKPHCNTAVNCSLFASSSVGMSLLNVIALQYHPLAIKWIAMGIILVGVVILVLAEDSNDEVMVQKDHKAGTPTRSSQLSPRDL